MATNPILVIGGLKIYPYGLFIAIGLLACILVFYFLGKKMGMPIEVRDFVFFVLLGGLATGFFFAKVFQAFYDWLAGRPFDILGSGLTVMGGLIGGAGMFLLLYFTIGKFYFKGEKKNWHIKYFNTLFRIAPICIVIAHGFGRLGCLMAGCCHGYETASGGIWMITPDEGEGFFVPTQLYEALFLFVLAGLMTFLLFKRCNIIMSVYLILYGIWRFIIEYFRHDYRGGLPGLTPSQGMSIAFVAMGIALIIVYLIVKLPIVIKREKQEDDKLEN